MIYEYTAQKHHFVIEWAKPSSWGLYEEGKWMASCNGVQLAAGKHPMIVLDALLKGNCTPTLDGINPATVNLPSHLDGWKTSRV